MIDYRGAGSLLCAAATGCWEALASGTALGQRATELGVFGRGHPPAMSRRLAEGGNAIARQDLLAEEARYLGIGFVESAPPSTRRR